MDFREEIESLKVRLAAMEEVDSALPVGTTRKRSDGHTYKKTGPGQWAKVTDKGDSEKGKEDEAAPVEKETTSPVKPGGSKVAPKSVSVGDAIDDEGLKGFHGKGLIKKDPGELKNDDGTSVKVQRGAVIQDVEGAEVYVGNDENGFEVVLEKNKETGAWEDSVAQVMDKDGQIHGLTTNSGAWDWA